MHQTKYILRSNANELMYHAESHLVSFFNQRLEQNLF